VYVCWVREGGRSRSINRSVCLFTHMLLSTFAVPYRYVAASSLVTPCPIGYACVCIPIHLIRRPSYQAADMFVVSCLCLSRLCACFFSPSSHCRFHPDEPTCIRSSVIFHVSIGVRAHAGSFVCLIVNVVFCVEARSYFVQVVWQRSGIGHAVQHIWRLPSLPCWFVCWFTCAHNVFLFLFLASVSSSSSVCVLINQLRTLYVCMRTCVYYICASARFFHEYDWADRVCQLVTGWFSKGHQS
jgi:hypothetical protein